MKISDRHPMGAGFFMLSWKFVKEKWKNGLCAKLIPLAKSHNYFSQNKIPNLFFTNISQFSFTNLLIPNPSLPITIAIGPVIS